MEEKEEKEDGYLGENIMLGLEDMREVEGVKQMTEEDQGWVVFVWGKFNFSTDTHSMGKICGKIIIFDGNIVHW